MNNKTDFTLSELMEELEKAILCEDIKKADEMADRLYRMQGGAKEDVIMPDQFPECVAANRRMNSGGQKMKAKSIKKMVFLAATVTLIAALGITALATNLFGLRDMVIKNDSRAVAVGSGTNAPNNELIDQEPVTDLIALQGYPDSQEYKASEEWSAFCQSYDTDGSILSEVGNNSNEYTEKYPLYLVYSKEMADKLEEIIAKYGLKLHESLTLVENSEQLISEAGTGNFLEKANSHGGDTMLGGYVYNDGSFHYDGEAVLESGTRIMYQLGNYVKGTFSDTYLNVGDAGSYKEWEYTTQSGVKVYLAMSEGKSLVITDLNRSFMTINVLNGTGVNSTFGSDSITEQDLEAFADLFDYSKIN